MLLAASNMKFAPCCQNTSTQMLQSDVREAAEAFGAVEDVGQEAGDDRSGMQWRFCFADARDAEVSPCCFLSSAMTGPRFWQHEDSHLSAYMTVITA